MQLLTTYKALYDFVNRVYAGEDCKARPLDAAGGGIDSECRAGSRGFREFQAANVLGGHRVSVLVKNCAIVTWSNFSTTVLS